VPAPTLRCTAWVPLLLTLVLIAIAACARAADSPLQTLRDLEARVAANPNDASAIRELAHAYTSALLQPDQDAARYARAALDSSNNVWILGNAAYMLQSQYNVTLQRGSPNKDAAALAERYFLRAQSLDPKLDRNAILPQIDLEQIKRVQAQQQQEEKEWARRFEEAAKNIRRLDPAAFSDLPPRIAAVLHARSCTVPQPAGATGLRNVIRGLFSDSGEESWAVLCSVSGWSTVLVFRNAQDARPESLARREDRRYLQSLGVDSVGYSREIHTVGRDFIAAHDNVYAGPKPAQIKHHGIEDAFLGKASEVWYFDAGQWFKLPGAD
jgi:hypothetical protein